MRPGWQTSQRNARRLRSGELEHQGSATDAGDLSAHLVDDQARAWWLERLNDREIAEAAGAMFGEADRGHIAAERARLLIGVRR